MWAIDDGIWQGNLDLADVFFLVAVIVFAFATILAIVASTKTRSIEGVLIPAGLTFLSLGVLVW